MSNEKGVIPVSVTERWHTPVAKDREYLRQIFHSEDSLTSTLLLQFVDSFGPDALEWDPLTIALEIKEATDKTPPKVIIDRIMAGIALIQSDQFYHYLPDFITLCNVLSGSELEIELFDPATTVECAWGITEALILWPPEGYEDGKKALKDAFDAEIIGYIQETMHYEGLVIAPKMLRSITGSPEEVSAALGQYVEDPELYAALYENSQKRVQEIDDLVRDRFYTLLSQIKSLRLRKGDVRDLIPRLERIGAELL